jgi:hypothetical protein
MDNQARALGAALGTKATERTYLAMLNAEGVFLVMHGLQWWAEAPGGARNQRGQMVAFGGKANLVQFTLFYSTLLTLTDGQTDRQTDRQRNEYTRFAWAGGTFFPVVLLCCVSFWLWWEIGFALHTHVGT